MNIFLNQNPKFGPGPLLVLIIGLGFISLWLPGQPPVAADAPDSGLSAQAAGDLDPTFGDNGLVAIAFEPENSSDRGRGVAVQADGKIVVAARVGTFNTGHKFVVLRFNPDGTLDPGFGLDGMATVAEDGNSSIDGGTDVVIQPDGKIVVIGTIRDQFVVARLNPDGSLDSGFGTGGQTIMGFSNGDTAREVILQPDGKIVVAGLGRFGTGAVLVGRLNSDGGLDTSFNEDGRYSTLGVGYGIDAVALQPDGKILVAGSYTDSTDPFAFLILRFDTNGNLDPTFDGDGQVTTLFDAGASAQAKAIVVQPDGKILLAGYGTIADPGRRDFALARYHPDGALDPTFAGDGKLMEIVSSGDDRAEALLLQADGKFIVGGEINDNFGLVRFNPDGSLDSDFGTGGQVVTAGATRIMDLAFQADGHIVAAGYAQISDSEFDFALARYLNDGRGGGSNTLPVVDLNGPAGGIDHSVGVDDFTQTAAPLAIVDPTRLTVSAPTTPTLQSATVTLTTRPDGGDESLAVDVGDSGLSQSYDSGSGVLSLTGSAEVSVYQTVLRTAVYQNNSPAPDRSTRKITFVVSDEIQSSLPAVATVFEIRGRIYLPALLKSGSQK